VGYGGGVTRGGALGTTGPVSCCKYTAKSPLVWDETMGVGLGNANDTKVTLGVQLPGTEVAEKDQYLRRLCSDWGARKTRT